MQITFYLFNSSRPVQINYRHLYRIRDKMFQQDTKHSSNIAVSAHLIIHRGAHLRPLRENYSLERLSSDSFSSSRHNARLTLHNGQPEVWPPCWLRDSGNISPEVDYHYSGKEAFRCHFVSALIISRRRGFVIWGAKDINGRLSFNE